MQARYYDPVIGRFYSNDPIGFRDVHSFNRYAYANNNPYKYVDPDGNSPVAIIARVAAPPVTTTTVSTPSGALDPFVQGKPSTPSITLPSILPSTLLVAVGALLNIPPEITGSLIDLATGSGDEEKSEDEIKEERRQRDQDTIDDWVDGYLPDVNDNHGMQGENNRKEDGNPPPEKDQNE